MKKKILSISLVVALLATGLIGATLAYFTDYEYAKNQFVVGDIDITLNEDFDDEAPLVPTDEPASHGVKKVVDITSVLVSVFLGHRRIEETSVCKCCRINIDVKLCKQVVRRIHSFLVEVPLKQHTV